MKYSMTNIQVLRLGQVQYIVEKFDTKIDFKIQCPKCLVVDSTFLEKKSLIGLCEVVYIWMACIF